MTGQNKPNSLATIALAKPCDATRPAGGLRSAQAGRYFFAVIFSPQVPRRSDKKSMVESSKEKIPHLLHTAEAMRQVRRAKQMFLLNWALESAKACRLDTRTGALLRPRTLGRHDRNLFAKD